MPPRTSTSVPSWYTPEPNELRDREAAARQEKRSAKVAERRARVEELKNKGNAAFKDADYRTAHDYYHQALKAAGETKGTHKKDALAAWLNLIQVYMKTNMPDLAETAATAALNIDPRNVKARFRRGLARKQRMMVHSAIADFQAVLRVDPYLKEAQTALEEARTLWDSGVGFHTGKEPEEDEAPSIDERALSSDEESDSSDYNHTGNGLPCQRYNQSRCRRGTRCQFSHAPDESAVRDNLGRNVCKNFLIDRCTLGVDECDFSHSKAYLPRGKGSPKWWEVDDSITATRELFDYWQTARAKGSSSTRTATTVSRPANMASTSRTMPRVSGRLGVYDDPMQRVDARERRITSMMEAELDREYTDAEFDHLCASGVNPYIDPPAVIDRALAEFRRNPAVAFRRSAQRREDDHDERTPSQRRYLNALMSELDHGYTDEEFEYLCSEGINPYVDHPDDVQHALARRKTDGAD